MGTILFLGSSPSGHSTNECRMWIEYQRVYKCVGSRIAHSTSIHTLHIQTFVTWHHVIAIRMVHIQSEPSLTMANYIIVIPPHWKVALIPTDFQSNRKTETLEYFQSDQIRMTFCFAYNAEYINIIAVEHSHNFCINKLFFDISLFV